MAKADLFGSHQSQKKKRLTANLGSSSKSKTAEPAATPAAKKPKPAPRSSHEKPEPRQLRDKASDVQHACIPRGHESYDDLVGTTTQQLAKHVREVMAVMDRLAPPETRETTGRRSQLVKGLLATEHFQTEMEASAMPRRAHMLVASGMAKRLQEFRDTGDVLTLIIALSFIVALRYAQNTGRPQCLQWHAGWCVVHAPGAGTSR